MLEIGDKIQFNWGSLNGKLIEGVFEGYHNHEDEWLISGWYYQIDSIFSLKTISKNNKKL